MTAWASAHPPSVATAGGGLAGLAAGCALADSGFKVTLFERRPYLGGRASSYEHPGTGEIVDNCQHVLLGCCTNLIDFYRRLGVEKKIRWFAELTFLEPGGRASVIGPSALPAPFHNGLSFLRASCLSLRDKLSIGRAIAALIPAIPADSGESFLAWLQRHGQTLGAIERFWKPILISALNEDLDKMSIPYAAHVVRESFMKSAAAGLMGVPMVPLSELYGVAADYIRERGGRVCLRSGVEGFEAGDEGVSLQITSGKEKRQMQFDYAVQALPFDGLERLLSDKENTQQLRQSLQHFSGSPITGIHLWFDRQISDLEHAVLLDRTIQWMFHKSKLLGRDPNQGSYVELVVSASNSLVEKSKQEIIELALAELREFFPEARAAKLVKSTIIKEIHATYSPRPGVDLYRPAAKTVWPRVFLAGDWTATGWPATMEGAVRSGNLAAEALATSAGGEKTEFVSPDLPAAGFMRLFG
jgi:zeta-carotene desaturase